MVARYNPCGRVVDIGRAPYKTRARLYPDSDQEFDIIWYIARDDAPLLGTPSAINSLQWEVDRDEWVQTQVGEVYGTRTQSSDYKTKPLALGEHYCGTPAEWRGDGKINTDPPYVVYRTDGLPTCCGLALDALGGAAGGGIADWTWIPYGPTCCDAPVSEVSHTYVVTVPPSTIVAHFWRWELPAGDWAVSVVGSTFDWFVDGPFMVASYGPACFNTPNLLGNNVPSVAFTLPGAATVCVKIQGQTLGTGGTYTLLMRPN